MAVTDLFARRATLARSARLLGQFRYALYVPSLLCVDHLR